MSSETDADAPSLCAGWSRHRRPNGDTLRTMLQRTGGRHALMFAAPTRLLSSKTICAQPAKTITRAIRTQAARDTHALCAHWQTHIASRRHCAVRQTRTRFAHSGKRQLVWMGYARMMHGGYGWKTARMMQICRAMVLAACISPEFETVCRAVTGNAALLEGRCLRKRSLMQK